VVLNLNNLGNAGLVMHLNLAGSKMGTGTLIGFENSSKGFVSVALKSGGGGSVSVVNGSSSTATALSHNDAHKFTPGMTIYNTNNAPNSRAHQVVFTSDGKHFRYVSHDSEDRMKDALAMGRLVSAQLEAINELLKSTPNENLKSLQKSLGDSL